MNNIQIEFSEKANLMDFISPASVLWQGGTPGRETDWNCPKNWSTGCVPDQNSEVLIPTYSIHDTYFPIVKERVTVRSIIMEVDVFNKTGLNYELINLLS